MSGIQTDTISEKTSDAGITIDGVLLKDNTVQADTITEKTTDAGITIDGVLLKDNTVQADTITRKTSQLDVDDIGQLILNEPDELTLDSDGAITVTQSHHTVDTYGGTATDDLTAIYNGVKGQILILQAADSSRTVVVKHTSGIYMDGGVDFSLDTTLDTIVFLYTIYGWVELSRSNNTS